MSQRTFKYRHYNVLTGWDRPLQRFFLVIETDQQAESDDDDYLYTNLRLKNPDRLSFQNLIDTLDGLGIQYPTSLPADLINDQRSNVGNYNHDYGTIDEPG